MALLKCPKCGGQISSVAKQCIHCGGKIKVCPECNNAVLESAEECGACGYNFAIGKTQQENNIKKQGEDISIIATKCYKAMPTLLVISVLSGLLMAVGVLIIVFNMISVLSAEGIDIITKVDSLENSIVIGTILTIFGSLGQAVSEFFIPIERNSLLKQNNADLIGSLSLYLSKNNFAPSFSEKVKIKAMLYSKVMSEVSLKKHIISVVVSALLTISGFIFLGGFFSKAADQIVMVKLLGATGVNTFKTVELTGLIPILIIGVIGSIFKICMKAYINKDVRTWVYEKLPDQYEKYITYLK